MNVGPIEIDFFINITLIDTGINHAEELSMLRKPEKGSKQNGKSTGTGTGRKKKQRGDRDSMASSNSNEAASIGSLDGIGPATPTRKPSPGNFRTPGQNGNPGYSSGSNYSGSIENLNTSLVNSPQRPSREAFDGLIRPTSYRDKASMNAG